ncbi:TIGR03862 family flavoprotein [Halobacteriovorax sp. JY17]|uniref:NAD(P)/FAD-dependent oxidoreductase n=1 Tax=Halobacteriovorax sp. JY17 TaxID=2014617 RepID=UPI000C537A48|nr:TIGR03862 family flavoprotein [Halobacteriovorax sp. JY17]PIK15227.1 MAG: aminoacetone oxidase family FAD-binding enzyme [Halobacteriovorax sp. JY17]
MNSVNIIGAGPSGLFCSYLLLKKGYKVSLYDQMGGVGKKFLVAGNGGLNLTHSEDLEIFVSRYGDNSKIFTELIGQFSPRDLRLWCDSLGVETFIGSSGRVFPKSLKAAELLSLWLKSLKENPNFSLNLKHKLIDIDLEGNLLFENTIGELKAKSDHTILCLGGGSWKKTGSDGLWTGYLKKLNLDLEEFRSMNCGFTVNWSNHFKEDFEDDYLKNIKVKFHKEVTSGEVMITKYGIEGGGVYALSSLIQGQIAERKTAIITLDLKPQLTEDEILEKINRPRKKNSLSNHLRKVLNLSKLSMKLLRELVSKDHFEDMAKLSKAIKNLPITLESARPLDEAISTSGGVRFSNLDKSLMLKGSKSIYLIGEMLDWEAPTGGYLLQGCFSMANFVSDEISKKDS